MINEIEQLLGRYQKQVNFLQSYYADKLKVKDFKITFSRNARTSHYNNETKSVVIAFSNLENIMSENYALKYKSFYSLLLHEVGHALHTGNLEYSVTKNVVEDNRIENLISKWNGRTDFKLMRYAFQDKVITLERLKEQVDRYNKEDFLRLRDNSSLYKTAALALLRTVHNKKYVEYFAKDTRNIHLLSALFTRHKEYINIDRVSEDIYRNTPINNKLSYEDYQNQTKRLDSLAETIYAILSEIVVNMIETTAAQKQQQQEEQDNEDEENESDNDKSDKSDDNDNEPQTEGSDGVGQQSKSQEKSDDTDDTDSSDNQDTDSEDTEDSESSDDTEDQDTEDEDAEDEDTEPQMTTEEDSDPEQDEIDKLENELSEALYVNTQAGDDMNHTIGRLTNYDEPPEDYPRIPLTAFTTLRRKGIKGDGTLPSYAGNIKQLNMRKYARRDFVKSPEKLFNKPTNAVSGGANPRIMFYIDISGSMDGYRLRTAVNYLQNFYDKLHKSVDIRLFVFGQFSYEITRQELNYTFLQTRTEGSTQPKFIEPKHDEEIIILTDGGWAREYMTETWRQRAHFIVIDVSTQELDYMGNDYRYADFRRVKNLHMVSSRNMVRELEKATSVISDKIRRR